MEKKLDVTLDQALQIAAQNYAHGNHSLAINTYQEILAAMPENHTATLQLAIIYYQLGQIDQALPYAKKAVTLEPDHAGSLNAYGIILGERQEYEKAIGQWKKALESKPDFVEVYSNMGNALWKLERFDESKEVCEKAITIKPDFADGYINYGNAVNSLGDTQEAIAIWEKALQYNPNHPNALINIGNGYRDLGDLTKAEEFCQKALEIVPEHPVALVNMGNVYFDRAEMEEAKGYFQKAIQLNPQYIDAHNNLASACIAGLQFEEAAAASRFAIAFDPQNLTAYTNLAVSLKELGKMKEAEEAARKALTIGPDNLEVKIDLADILLLLDRYKEAEHFYEQIMQEKPDNPHVMMKLAAVQERMNNFDEALATINTAIADNQEMPELYHRKATIYLMANKIDASLEALEEALALKPDNVPVLVSKSETLQTKGDMEGAKEAALLAAQYNPNLAGAYYTLSKVHKFTPDDPHYLKMRELGTQSHLMPKYQAAPLHFALFKAEQDVKNYEAAFESLKKGNDYKRATVTHDRSEQDRMFSQTKQKYTPAYIESFQGKGCESDVPVFIVGMPRSGTTLTEQIIASHPAVFGAGELHYLSKVEEELGAITEENCKEHGERYIAMAQGINDEAKNAKRITDKMPGNYMRMAQIMAAMPNAKIIHCQRNPMDTMLSCYKQLFARGHYWCYNLDEMAEHYAYYEDMMQHWRDNFPDRFIEVVYEDTVADLETQARRLIDHVELEWDDACLTPHKSKRSILTASKGQVRKPVYKTSVEAWRRYEEQLLPLQDALEKYRGEIGVKKDA